MIEFNNLTLHLNDKVILENCSFSASKGEKIVITGDSGSGKTTILNLIMGFTEADAGTITFNGTPLNHRSIAGVRRSAAYIGQEPALASDTVREALLLPFTYKSNRDTNPSESQIAEILDYLMLDNDIQNKKTSLISGGEKQRVAIARALLMNKKIFLADEITSALDKKIIERLYELFSKDEYSLISVSHDQTWIEFCSRHMKLENGRLTEVRK